MKNRFTNSGKNRMKRAILAFVSILTIAGNSMAGVFVENGIEYSINDSQTAVVNGVSDYNKVVIPSEINIGGISYAVTEISETAFQNLEINELHIPASIKKIAQEAFHFSQVSKLFIEDLESWCNIDFEYSIYISHYYVNYESYSNPIGKDTEVFIAGEKITDLVIPAEVQNIPDFAFTNLNCDSVSIGNGVNQIGVKAFNNSSVKTLILGDNIESIGQEAFEDCLELSEIRLNDNLSSVGALSFSNTTVKNVYVPTLESWLGIEYYTRQMGGIYSELPFGRGYDLYIGDMLAEDIVIPSGYETLNDLCFAGSSIKSVTCNEGIVNTGFFTFEGCSSLESVSFPASLERIGSIFMGCENMKTLELRGMVPPKIMYYSDELVFNLGLSYENCQLVVPEESIDSYKMSEPWCYFKNIRAIGTSWIDSLTEVETNPIIYNLQGVKFDNAADLQNGIYIINGKKVLVSK